MNTGLDMSSLQKRKSLTGLLEKKWDAEKHRSLQAYQKILNYQAFRNREWESLSQRLQGLQSDIEQHYVSERIDAVFYQAGLALMQDITQQMDIVFAELEKLNRQIDEKKRELAMLDARVRYYAEYHESLEKHVNHSLLQQEQQQAMEQYISNQYYSSGGDV